MVLVMLQSCGKRMKPLSGKINFLGRFYLSYIVKRNSLIIVSYSLSLNLLVWIYYS